MAEGQEERIIEIRSLAGLTDLNEAVALQKAVWGFDDIELLPLRLFVVAQKVGGQTFGAFHRDRMIGFLLAIPGLKQGAVYLHSHMMGILPGYRDRGVGRMLKLRQREEALARGIRLIEWTFDPLELKNAYFNITRLGAIVQRYVRDQYGTTTSHLHGGLPTDRCVAEWHLDSARVSAVLAGRPTGPAPAAARIAVPNEIGTIRTSDPARALAIQDRISSGFEKYLDQGMAVTGFEKSEDESAYLFEQWDSK